jgi:hypothetical protein
LPEKRILPEIDPSFLSLPGGKRAEMRVPQREKSPDTFLSSPEGKES